MTTLRVLTRAGRSALLLSIAALVSATIAAPVRAQVVPLADLLALTGRVDGLRTDTDTNSSLLTAQTGLLSGLRTDLGSLGTRLGSVNADVADLKVQVGDLRGLLDALPDITGPDGIPLDLPAIIDTLNTTTATNTTNIANLKLDVTAIQKDIVTQAVRIDDHERRITQNTSEIRRHDLAIGELQSQMANGFAGVQEELRDHSRRIDKATEGVAMAFAMKSPAVPDNKNFAISGSFGAFENKTALAFSGGVRATEALQFDAGVAVGLDQGSVGGRAGATLAW